MRLAVIPARGGSKRIPRKNIRTFGGLPIIAWSIRAAIQSGCFDRIIVSTDDAEIAEAAKEYGAEAPFQRPGDLSDDHTGTVPVVAHA
ncbi:MAG: acylneuraminate cytidylyltransferase family protein, partial [Mesorhizobium sp.]